MPAPVIPPPRVSAVPIVASFFGIVIRMYYQDHVPAHFHAEYRGDQGSFSLSGDPIFGEIRSRTARRLIREWADAHRLELEQNWRSSREGRSITPIEPLE